MNKKHTLLLLSLVGWITLLFGQTTGTVTVNTAVNATAGTVSCALTAPSLPAVHITCAIGSAQVLVMDTTPAVGATANGASGSFTSAGNTVGWIITQPTAGTVTWQMAANSTSKSGTFQ